MYVCVCFVHLRNVFLFLYSSVSFLLQELASCLLPTGKSPATIALESLCLCSDDLPPKDGIVDEAHEDIQRAIAQWWSNVTKMTTPNKLNGDDFKVVLAR